jgi:hypothetical protein
MRPGGKYTDYISKSKTRTLRDAGVGCERIVALDIVAAMTFLDAKCTEGSSTCW